MHDAHGSGGLEEDGGWCVCVCVKDYTWLCGRAGTVHLQTIGTGGGKVGGDGGGHAPPLPVCRFPKYHMTAPMCCRLLQVNHRPQKRAGKKKCVCNL